jgi:hypothetical protein
MNGWLWVILSAIAVPCLVGAITFIPDWERRRRMREWDAWAAREKAKHLASMKAKAEVGDFDWDYAKKGRRL